MPIAIVVLIHRLPLPTFLNTRREPNFYLPFIFFSLVTVATCDDPNSDVVIEGFGWDGACLSFIVDGGDKKQRPL